MTMTETNSNPIDASDIQVVPQSPTIGAELRGINLARPLTAAAVGVVRQALLDWKVVFMRDQDVTTEQHLDFARLFGDLEVHPFSPHKPEYPEVLAISHDEDNPGFENIWHSDVTWRLEPSLGSVLPSFDSRSVVTRCLPTWVPRTTASRKASRTRLRAAWRATTSPDFASDEEAGRLGGEAGRVRRAISQPRTPGDPARTPKPVESRSTSTVDSPKRSSVWTPTSPEELLEILYRQAAYPEYQVRFKWEPNSIAFCNRSCQHYAVSDYFPDVRRVERVTIIGDAPYYDASEAPTHAAASPFNGVLKMWTNS